MIIDETQKTVVEKAATITLVTMDPDGTPHPIIAGKAEVQDNTLVFGIYRMEKTQKNIAVNPKAWVLAATMEGGPKGYRFAGSAVVADKKLVFTPDTAEQLL